MRGRCVLRSTVRRSCSAVPSRRSGACCARVAASVLCALSSGAAPFVLPSCTLRAAYACLLSLWAGAFGVEGSGPAPRKLPARPGGIAGDLIDDSVVTRCLSVRVCRGGGRGGQLRERDASQLPDQSLHRRRTGALPWLASALARGGRWLAGGGSRAGATRRCCLAAALSLIFLMPVYGLRMLGGVCRRTRVRHACALVRQGQVEEGRWARWHAGGLSLPQPSKLVLNGPTLVLP